MCTWTNAELLSSMVLEDNRIASYTKLWPHSRRRKCSPRRLARTGFFYIGTEDSPDATQCFMCDKQLDGWEPSDDAAKEHAHHSPACPFLNLDLSEHRLKTFKFWPTEFYSFNVEQFVAAGFFHTPSKKQLDCVTCFQCGATASGFESNADPLDVHAEACEKTCSYLMQARAQQARNASASASASEVADSEDDHVDEEDQDEMEENDGREQEDEQEDEPATVKRAQPLARVCADATVSKEASAKRAPLADVNGKTPIYKKHKAVEHTSMEPSVGHVFDDLSKPELQDMTMLEFLKLKQEELVYVITDAVEHKIKLFSEQAAATRQQLEGITTS